MSLLENPLETRPGSRDAQILITSSILFQSTWNCHTIFLIYYALIEKKKFNAKIFPPSPPLMWVAYSSSIPGMSWSTDPLALTISEKVEFCQSLFSTLFSSFIKTWDLFSLGLEAASFCGLTFGSPGRFHKAGVLLTIGRGAVWHPSFLMLLTHWAWADFTFLPTSFSS